MRKGIVYCIKNKVNGKKYIGATIHKRKRWNNHKCDLRNDQHINKHLQNSWNKYGEKNFKFEVVENNIKENILGEKEIYWIDFYNTFEGKGYNQTIGGFALSGENAPFYGHNHTEETKRKMRKAAKGRELSEEVKKRLSKIASGRTHTEETKKKMRKAHLGKKLSKEHINKISKAKSGKNHHFYGKKHTEETKRKMSEAHSGPKHHLSKISKEMGIKIYNEYHNTDKFQKVLAKKYDTAQTVISRIVRCEHWTTRGLK